VPLWLLIWLGKRARTRRDDRRGKAGQTFAT
jgi:hypothetical protein